MEPPLPAARPAPVSVPREAPPGARTAFGLWLLEAGGLVAGAALLVSVGAMAILDASDEPVSRGGLLPLLRRVLPGLRVAILAGFLAALAGAATAATEGSARARLAAAGAAVAFAASVGAALALRGYGAVLTLRPERPLVWACVAANAVGWWLALTHARVAARAAGRPDVARLARRFRAGVLAGGLWLLGGLALARAFARARDAGEPHDALATTLVVVGLGLLAHAGATVAGSLRALSALREALVPPPDAHAS
jgi:hypothetical protein